MSENITFTEPEASIFVAYTPTIQVPGPDGKTVSAGSQTLVNYIKGLKVSKITAGGLKGSKATPDQVRTVRVEFDPESIGLSHPIAANIAPDDPGLKVLEEAHENDLTVNVAIESIRKSKNSKDKTPISPLTPIYVLLGADTPGAGGDMSVAGQNTSKVVAAVNGVTTKDCRSDATQWASLQKNRAGIASPEGYELVTNPDDWRDYAFIVPDEEYRARREANANAPAMDLEVLKEALRAVMQEQVAPAEPRNYTKRYVEGMINEGKPFDLWLVTGNGQRELSMGSYVASKYRYVYEWANEYLNRLMQSKPADEEIETLAKYVFTTADLAQVAAYGGNVKPNRIVSSYTEACRWVQWAIDNRFGHDSGNQSDVVDFVVAKMHNGRALVRDSLDITYADNKQSDSANSAPAQAPASNDADAKMKKLNACLQAVNKGWGNADELRRIWGKAKETGLLKAPVAVTDSGVVFQRGSSTNLGDVIGSRGKELKENSVPEAPKAESKAPVAETPAEEPVTTPVADAPAQEEDNAPMDANAFASMMSEASEDSGWNEKLAAIKTKEDAAALWATAASNLNETVEYKGETMLLKQAFEKLSEQFSGGADPEQAAQDLAESAVKAKTLQELKELRRKAQEADVLEVLVSDGQSDNEMKLNDLFKARHSALK